MTYNTTDSVLRRHYDQHLSAGGAELAGTNEEGLRMAGVAAGGAAAVGATGERGYAQNSPNHASANAQGNAHQHDTRTGAAYESTETTTHNTTNKGGSGALGFLKILIPAAILGLLAWGATKFMGTTPDMDTPTVEVPSMELPEISGLPEGMGAELGTSFSGAASALGSITDVDSANTALPALDGLTGMLDKVPEGSRGELGGMIGKLTPMIDKASAIPGVGDVLAPFTEKLQSFM